MVVKAFYTNGKSEEITDYVIENGEDLQVSQTSVKIKYQGKFASQKIKVTAKKVEEPEVINPVNSKFDKAKAVVNSAKAYYYTDKTKKEFADAKAYNKAKSQYFAEAFAQLVNDFNKGVADVVAAMNKALPASQKEANKQAINS